jgi:hypothetical protein
MVGVGRGWLDKSLKKVGDAACAKGWEVLFSAYYMTGVLTDDGPNTIAMSALASTNKDMVR